MFKGFLDRNQTENGGNIMKLKVNTITFDWISLLVDWIALSDYLIDIQVIYWLNLIEFDCF